MQKILSIVWYKILPPVFGGQKGIAGFNQHLSKSFSLVCLCARNNEPGPSVPYPVQPTLPVNQSQFLNPLTWRRIKTVALEERPSFIIAEHPYHGLAALRAKKAVNAKLIVHSHNIESERFRKIGKWWWPLLRWYEKRVHQKADLNLFKTAEDREFALHQFKLDPSTCLVIPYGIDKPPFDENAGATIRKRHGIAAGEKILLFAGTLDYGPNAAAVQNIYDQIVPAFATKGIPFKVIICGRNRSGAYGYIAGLSHPAVIQVGEVENIDTYFQAADVFINAVDFGGGIQTKVIDALANHCPVVCFDHMLPGIPVGICGNNILPVAENDWEAFSNSIEKAILHKYKTPDAFFTYFDWEKCLRPLLEKLKTM